MKSTQFPNSRKTPLPYFICASTLKIVREYTSRRKIHVYKQLREEHSSYFASKMTLPVPYCTNKYGSNTLGNMVSRHVKSKSKGRL